MKYLHYSSCHLTHGKRSILKSLSIRAQNPCSDRNGFNNYIDKLFIALVERGYPEKRVKQQIKSPKF